MEQEELLLSKPKNFMSTENDNKKNSNLPISDVIPHFCFTCGSELEEVGLGWLQCKSEKCGNVYLPFLDKENNQNLMLQNTPFN